MIRFVLIEMTWYHQDFAKSILMKRMLLFLNILLVLSSCSNTTSVIKSEDNQWKHQKRENHLNNRNDSSTWDIKMLKQDQQDIDFGDSGPFQLGVFPQPKYDLIGKGSFKGVGVVAGQFEIKDRKIFMRSFFVKENSLNKARLIGRKDEVFFQILVLTDTIDNVNYNLAHSVVLSRNHPDYLGQGFISTKDNRIDYVAFITAENNAYAIVNTRIFDLSFGKTILIAPRKDQTLRSLQIKSPEMSSDSITKYTELLIKDEKVIEFFQSKDNI